MEIRCPNCTNGVVEDEKGMRDCPVCDGFCLATHAQIAAFVLEDLQDSINYLNVKYPEQAPFGGWFERPIENLKGMINEGVKND